MTEKWSEHLSGAATSPTRTGKHCEWVREQMFLWICQNKNQRILKQCCKESNILRELEAKFVNLNREVDGSRGEGVIQQRQTLSRRRS